MTHDCHAQPAVEGGAWVDVTWKPADVCRFDSEASSGLMHHSCRFCALPVSDLLSSTPRCELITLSKSQLRRDTLHCLSITSVTFMDIVPPLPYPLMPAKWRPCTTPLVRCVVALSTNSSTLCYLLRLGALRGFAKRIDQDPAATILSMIDGCFPDQIGSLSSYINSRLFGFAL